MLRLLRAVVLSNGLIVISCIACQTASFLNEVYSTQVVFDDASTSADRLIYTALHTSHVLVLFYGLPMFTCVECRRSVVGVRWSVAALARFGGKIEDIEYVA